jgi:hypothetical protein
LNSAVMSTKYRLSVGELSSEHEVNIYVNSQSKKWAYDLCYSHEGTLYRG